MNFRDFVEVTRDAIESLAFGLHGDRDLTPMLHVEGPAGIAVQPVAGWFFESSAGTQLLVERYVLPLIAQDHATKVAWTYCAWEAPADTVVRPSAHPDRREILLATFIDPEVVEHWAAPLVRTGDQVIVGQWRSSLPNAGGGPMITTIQEKLR